ISAALKAVSNFLTTNESASNYKEIEADFINQANEIMNNTKDQVLSDSAFFAISDLKSKSGLLNLLVNEDIDRELKVFAIDQNFSVIQKILSNPSEDEIRVVIDAMKLLPIQDLADDLKTSINKIDNQELIEQAEEVIQIMETEGVPANKKWLEQ